ncbi:putative acyltransferase CST26 [Zancudomyces culisetae]|uniref:Putative acyltransferase CST26 n=1 Tax=Zancudomyces culisetae TaxID=1213189 RepID=A0A1R1PH11_ZANCU|nr:putative acyltransferase CST26 [Zancudomyces culisetae]|eukprot:OMH80227.1 putative acyltransferase CST26 [Zancudomyces culisetae]
MLQNSRGIVKYVYDFTIAYSGVKEHEYAEQVYSLKDIYLMGKYPHQIHIHIRKFAVEGIPEDEGDFTSWIRDRFYEKDEILDHFYKNGKLVDNEKDPELHSCINPFKLSTLARELVFLNLTGVIFFYLLKKVVLLMFRCLFTLF